MDAVVKGHRDALAPHHRVRRAQRLECQLVLPDCERSGARVRGTDDGGLPSDRVRPSQPFSRYRAAVAVQGGSAELLVIGAVEHRAV